MRTDVHKHYEATRKSFFAKFSCASVKDTSSARTLSRPLRQYFVRLLLILQSIARDRFDMHHVLGLDLIACFDGSYNYATDTLLLFAAKHLKHKLYAICRMWTLLFNWASDGTTSTIFYPNIYFKCIMVSYHSHIWHPALAQEVYNIIWKQTSSSSKKAECAAQVL
jgi:hypothetical protein